MSVLTRIYYCCDLHGSDLCFRKVLNSIKYDAYKANVVLVSGDLSGKALIPFIEEQNGSFQYEFMGGTERVRSKDELREAQKKIHNMGYYTYITTKEEKEGLENDPKRLEDLFEELISRRLHEWVDLAEERLRNRNVSFFMMLGNDDPPSISHILAKSDIVRNPEGLALDVAGHEMVSIGWSNPTPWKTYRECPEEDLGKKIVDITASVKDMRNCIFNFHVPPFDSTLDSAPKLDGNLRPTIDPSGGLTMIPVGSTAVRKAIETGQPVLSVHGHVHESSGGVMIGRTLCLNPGSEYSSGILRGYLVDLEGDKVKWHQLVVG